MSKSTGVWLFGVSGLIVCGAGLLLWLSRSCSDTNGSLPGVKSSSSVIQSSTESPVISKEPTSQPVPRVVASESSSQTPAVPATARLFVAMNSASDLRVFAEAAKKEPGGYLYAIRAIDECRALKEALLLAKPAAVAQTQAALDPRLQAQAGAAEWLSRRCEGFTNAELGPAEQKFLVQTAKERDRLYALLARTQSSAAADPPSREAALGEVLRSKDPALVGSIAWSMAKTTPKGDSAVVFVDGQPFGGLDGNAYAAAWSLAACSLTGTCGIKDSQVAHFCAFEGKCADDIASLALMDYRQAGDVGKVKALAARLESIMASGDVRRLRPPAQN